MATLDDFRLTSLSRRAFSLSLPVRPGSVRDSMFRAEQFCKKFIKAKEVPPRGNILVVGLGPSGMTVVASLLNAKFRVTACSLVPDSDKEVLRKCYSRVISPTTYDYPAEHWPEGKYPFESNTELESYGELPWEQALARDAHNEIVDNFNAAAAPFKISGDYLEAEPAILKRLDPTTVVSPSGVAFEGLLVEIQREKLIIGPGVVDAVIICTGPSRKRKVSDGSAQRQRFATFGWWSNDDKIIMTPQIGAGKRVLILGGGDGGVADFVRLLTGIIDPADCLGRLQLPAETLNMIASANELMWQNFTSSAPPDHELLVTAQAKLIKAIDDGYASDAVLRKSVDDLLLPKSERPAVQLAVPCYHFGICYFGNRVVAQLLARAIVSGPKAGNDGLVPFRVAVEAVDISGLGEHQCADDPEKCAEAKHLVSFERATCIKGIAPPDFLHTCVEPPVSLPWKATAIDSTEKTEFDRVITRYGPDNIAKSLPENLIVALNEKSRPPLRDVPPFYLL